jgi:hypothetical protein
MKRPLLLRARPLGVHSTAEVAGRPLAGAGTEALPLLQQSPATTLRLPLAASRRTQEPLLK